MIRVRAPASTANLGPGFDVFGLALDAYYDVVEVSKRNDGIINIESNDNIPLDVTKNSAGLAALRLCKDYNINDGLNIRIKKGIPIGYGLGSSAASAAATVKALDTLYSLGLSNEDMVRYASLGEEASAGSIHYDNVSASLFGGFVVVRSEPLRVLKIDPPELDICIAIPNVTTPNKKTGIARSILPKEVELYKLVSNTANASMMVAGFMLKDKRLIADAMRDLVVEPVRSNMIKGYKEVKDRALKAGALAVTISGAGPSMLILLDGNVDEITKAVIEGFKTVNIDSKIVVCKPDKEGAKVI